MTDASPDPLSARAVPAPDDDMLVLGGTGDERAEPAEGGAACAECGEGTYDADGYCGRCGARAADPHDHEEVAPAPWLAGVCDRGVRHATNEDALAVAAEEGTGRAAIVVCDGVSTAMRSQEASAHAVSAAVEVLMSSASGAGTPASGDVVEALGTRLDAAADAAAEAVAGVTGGPAADRPPGDQGFATNPSCTFVAALVEDGVAVVGSVGDSRAYWLPDAGRPQLLTTDDSWAEEQIRLGAPRADAEAGPQAHTITRWLGVDAPDHTPAKVALPLTQAGWLLVCSDGLWNYASAPDALADVVDSLDRSDSLDLARGLVEWANAQGGRDNITVGLARIDPAAGAEPAEAPPAGLERPVDADVTERLTPTDGGTVPIRETDDRA